MKPAALFVPVLLLASCATQAPPPAAPDKAAAAETKPGGEQARRQEKGLERIESQPLKHLGGCAFKLAFLVERAHALRDHFFRVQREFEL